MTSLYWPTSIKNGQLADGGNPKYTLRHGLGGGYYPKVMSRSYQGQISQKGSEYLVFVVFASIVLIL